MARLQLGSLRAQDAKLLTLGLIPEQRLGTVKVLGDRFGVTVVR